MARTGRNGLLPLPESAPLYGRPNRLSWEARRNARMVETGLLAGLGLLYTRVNRMTQTPDLWHAVYVCSALVSMVGGWWARRRLLARAKWFETTDRWWERLDELPHIVPFARAHLWWERASLRGALKRRAGRRRNPDSVAGKAHHVPSVVASDSIRSRQQQG